MGGPMGGHMGGGMPGSGRGGRNFTNDLYADYNGPDGTAANGGMDPAVAGGEPAAFAPPAEPSAQIHVRNVSVHYPDASLSCYADTEFVDSYHGRLPTRTLSSSLRPLVQFSLPRYCLKANDRKDLVLSSSRKSARLRKRV